MSDKDEFAGFTPVSGNSTAAPSGDPAPAKDAAADEFSGFTPATTIAPRKDEAPASRSWLDEAKHQGAQLLKAGANTVAALPLMAEDMGVGVRNLASGLTGGSYHQYEYPSDTFHQGMNEIFGAPENAVEKVNDVALPIIMGMGANSAGAPAAIRSALGTPEAASQVPSNFVNATDAKRQLLAQTIKKGQDLGLVVPPQTTNPSAVNAAVETVGGKVATAQHAAVHNQPIANAVAAQELGLNPDAPITPGAIRQVIKDAGEGYQAVRNVGPVKVDDQYLKTIAQVAADAAGPAASFPGTKVSPLVDEADSLWQPTFDSSHAVDKIAELRDASSMAYRQGDTRLGKGYRQFSNAIEDQIDRHISNDPTVSPDLVDKFRSSRVLAAKAHSVLDALNPSTGDVSIQALAKSEDPLTGNLKTLADFGNAAPKATQDVAKIGSSGVSHLDTLGTMFTGAFGAHELGAWGTTAGVAYPLGRWGARAYALGPGQGNALPKAVVGGASNPKTAGAIEQAAIQGEQQTPPTEDLIERKSGGKVDIDSLVDRLVSSWKKAKKATDQTTKPLLNVPDSVIVKALDIAQEHL